jgi:hypothetical protein
MTVLIFYGFDRLGDIRAKLPDETAGEILAHLYAMRDAPTLTRPGRRRTGLPTPTAGSTRWPALPMTWMRCWPSTG